MTQTAMVAIALSLVACQGAQTMAQTGPKTVITAGAPPIGPYSPATVGGGFVYVSGLLGTGADGQLVGPDVASQTRRILDRMGEILTAANSSMGQVVSVSVFLKNPGDFAAMNEAYRAYFTDKAPTRTTVASDLLNGALVEIAAVAVPNGTPKETMHPDGWVKSARPYSTIVKAGGLVFLSGLISRKGTDDSFVPGDMAQQTRTVLENAKVLLKTAGLTLENVVSSKVFITSDTGFAAMNEVYRTYFPNNPPARATAVTPLMTPDFLVEITLVATTGDREVLGPVSATLPLSQAIRTGHRIYLSGVLGNTDANVGDITAQTRETLTRIQRTLTAQGLTFANVVDTTVYLTDLSHFAAMNAVYREFFPTAPPARATVGTGLVSKNGLVELVMTVVR
jgi:2-iminobutanoate/2-iminopropanoate deaminase